MLTMKKRLRSPKWNQILDIYCIQWTSIRFFEISLKDNNKKRQRAFQNFTIKMQICRQEGLVCNYLPSQIRGTKHTRGEFGLVENHVLSSQNDSFFYIFIFFPIFGREKLRNDMYSPRKTLYSAKAAFNSLRSDYCILSLYLSGLLMPSDTFLCLP